MLRLIFALSLAVSGTAFACDGEKCDKANCPMPTASATAPASSATATVAPLPEGTRASLEVTGMHCLPCAEKVKSALLQVDGVKGANVDLATGRAEISYDNKKTNLDALVKAVNKTGSFQAKAATAPASTGTN